MNSVTATIDRINQGFYRTKDTPAHQPAESGSSTSDGARCSAHDGARSDALRAGAARSLTTYKEVVYNFQKYQEDYGQIQSNLERIEHKSRLSRYLAQGKIIYYGLTEKQLELVERKHMLQRRFLNLSVLYDKVTGNTIPLRDLIISANHSPHRYHAEVNNRVGTLVGEAERKGLVPVFLTITLPSRYHPFKLVNKKLEDNPKYDGTPPREAVKALTRRFAKLRNDRALRIIPKDERIYFRVNEPHQSGTPHTHILYYMPAQYVARFKKAFKRLFPEKGNDIQTDIRDGVGYVMKYINKTLPKSKSKKLSKRDRYLNAWYAHHRVTRFSSSRTLAPLYLYRLLHHRYSLRALTRLMSERKIRVLRPVDDLDTIAEIFEDEELIYMRNDNFTLEKHQG
jgi:hypothetical protein